MPTSEEKVEDSSEEEEGEMRVTLVSQLACAMQFSLARGFPSLLKKRFWAKRFGMVRHCVDFYGTSDDKKQLAEIEADFLAAGISLEEIDENLHYLRTLGFGPFEPIVDGTQDVDEAAMARVIAAAPIHEDIKDFAIKALPVLRKYQVPTNPLLATDYCGEMK